MRLGRAGLAMLDEAEQAVGEAIRLDEVDEVPVGPHLPCDVRDAREPLAVGRRELAAEDSEHRHVDRVEGAVDSRLQDVRLAVEESAQ